MSDTIIRKGSLPFYLLSEIKLKDHLLCHPRGWSQAIFCREAAQWERPQMEISRSFLRSLYDCGVCSKRGQTIQHVSVSITNASTWGEIPAWNWGYSDLTWPSHTVTESKVLVCVFCPIWIQAWAAHNMIQLKDLFNPALMLKKIPIFIQPWCQF